MPPRRSSRQQQESSPPPPPYDGRYDKASSSQLSGLDNPIFARVGQQTIPKTREVQLQNPTCQGSFETRDGRLAMKLDGDEDEKKPDGLKSVESRNQQVSSDRHLQHTTAADRRKRSLDQHQLALASNSNGEDEFISSLAVSKSSFFRNITIEPLAFLAIMALYLEFPAIQDLIYTKICLEVVGKHPNLMNQSQQSNPFNTSTTDQASGGTILSNSTLPASGRIQERLLSTNQSSQMAHDNQVVGANDSSNSFGLVQADLWLICDRMNKTAVPREIRQEILDINSLFWLKYQILVCLLCALFSPYWGGVSDKIGRLLPLNVPIASSILCNSISLTFGILISHNSHPFVHINWLYSGAVLVGISGGQSVLIMNAFSFISDNTTSDERSKRVTVLESVIFVGHSVGFLLSKLIMPMKNVDLAGTNGQLWLNRHFVSFSACILLNLVCLIYSYCRLRHQKLHRFMNNFEREQREAARLGADSLSVSTIAISFDGKNTNDEPAVLARNTGAGLSCDRLRELTSDTPDDPDGPIARADKSNWSVWDTLATFSYYKETYEIATKPRNTRTIILLLLFLGFISSLSLATLMSLFYIYTKTDPFNWSTGQYSSWNANSSLTRGFALIILTLLMKFVPSWRAPDALVAAVGFVGKGAGLLMIGLAQSTALINWSLIAFTFSEFSMPPIRSLLSKLVIKEELCKIYSCLGALQSLCFILGNLVFYLAFTTFMQSEFFRLSFIILGGIEIGALIVVLLIHKSIQRQILIT